MLSSVRSRPNHYETLGLTPAASEAEINEAFARKIGLLRAHPVRAAQVCIAYETLRNPASRRDYDLSQGLTPQRLPQPRQLTIAMTQQRWAPFIGAMATEPPPHAARPSDPHVTAHRQPQPTERPRQPKVEPAQEQPRREALPRPTKPVEIPSYHQLRPFVEQRIGAAEGRPFRWNRTGLTVSALVIGVIIIGAWAGTIAGNDVEAAQAEQVSLPKRKPLPPSTPAPAAPSLAAASAEVADPAAHQAAAAIDDSSAPASSAKLPLPNNVIARTIDRIGYACGEVASAAAAGPGAFKVTCTSGHAYQATRVGARYRFHRLAG